MDFVKGDQKGYSDKEAQDQEDQEEEDIITSKFSSSSSHINNNNYGSSPKYKAILVPPPPYHQRHHQYQQKPWVVHNHSSPEAINFMDLSLNHDQQSDAANNNNNWPPTTQREHMFHKVVTPSDVGKLNRLVIPKQHAERYFPIDSSTNEKGLLLNFQDRTGKQWRFRYSYWNSSQSYVMTKGWSRFVKEKKLDAGDIVSFERGVGDSGTDRLYIDWRRRPPPPPPPHHHHGQFGNSNDRWGGGGGGGRLYSLLQRPHPSMSMPMRHHEHFHPHGVKYNHIHHPYHHHHQHQINQQYLQHQYHQGAILGQIERVQGERDHVIQQYPMVIDSVPFVQQHHGKSSSGTSSTTRDTTAAKRLRLFGVDMEYSSPNIQEDQTAGDEHQYQILSSTVIPNQQHYLPSSSLAAPLELRLPFIGAHPSLPNTSPADQYLSKKGKSTSLSFFLDP